MNTIEQAREVSRTLEDSIKHNRTAPKVLQSLCKDTIDVLILEVETFHEANKKLRAELDALKSQEPVAYGIHQITDDEGVEEWDDIRTSPDVAKEDADGMMETGRGEQYEVVPLYRTAGAQASVTCQIYGHVVGACVECNTHEEADQKAELDALRADVRRLTGVAFLASAERDELRMDLERIKGQEPVGALVEVRRVNGPWQRYNIYDSVSLAEDTKRRTDGSGIEVRVVPLYSAPVQAQEQRKPSPIHQEWLEERAHRRCSRYIMIDTEAPYQFDVHTLMDLVRDIEAKLKEQP